MADRLYISNKNETVRMFESDFMEFFSRVHPVTPLALYLPVVGYMLYVSLWQRHLPFVAVAALFLLGVLLWTLVEYLIHRYIFHYEPKTRWGKQLHFMIHGVHHDYPNDARRLVMPPIISIPLAFLFFGLFFLIFGSLAPAVFAGLVFGYLCYDMLHYATHHLAMKRGVWLWLKQYHLRHHFKDDHVGYGISSPLWDYIFRTTRK
ncbi:MAG TPA: sterol desaturase family protein [Candidatus Dormibacteraeota bacterium]|jgi:sterol desaturase/sphingolipid hydroxylase (fatty acid hydroxylase superfamily)|nr:sterol desaturase family protein [Candidatus Dormibacteraeota bacterium]